MATPYGIKARGWVFDGPNGYMEAWDSGTAVARFDSTAGVVVLIDGFDLNGQTLTSVNTSGSAAIDTWVTAFTGANGSNDESPVSAAAFKIGGTVAYVPCFASALA